MPSSCEILPTCSLNPGTSHTSDVINSSCATVHELDGHSNVSRPPPPPRLRHLSELIDPAELPIDGHVRSPSGHLLAPEQFLVHPDRPLSIRERQAAIQERVRAASRLGVEVEEASEVPTMPSPKTTPETSPKKVSSLRDDCNSFALID